MDPQHWRQTCLCVSPVNQHVVLKVDNIGCFFAWENKNVTKDPHASVLVRALALISIVICRVMYMLNICREYLLGMQKLVIECQERKPL
jgi:hypothetical protein